MMIKPRVTLLATLFVASVILCSFSISQGYQRQQPMGRKRSSKDIYESIKLSPRELIDHLYLTDGSLNETQLENPLVGRLELSLAKSQGYSPDKMELLFRYFKNQSVLDGELTVSELDLTAVWARFHFVVDFSDFSMHRYDTMEDVRNSLGPHVDNELCLRQLEQLNARLDKLEADKLNSTDLNLYRLLDTFGRVPAGVTSTNVFWPGMYDNCIKHQIESSEGRLPTRYCLAHLRHSNWPRTTLLGSSIAFKAGVCLPRACDPLRHKHKYELIQRLIDFNNREVDKGQVILDSLYCLPDEDSPMRMWWREPKAALAVAAFISWTLLVIYATVKYELSRRRPQSISIKGGEKEPEASSSCCEFFNTLSITSNLAILLSIEPAPPVSVTTTDSEGQAVKVEVKEPVNLRIVDGIKAYLIFRMITGHVFTLSSKLKLNGADIYSDIGQNSFLINGFFTITGLLIAYKQFGQNNWIEMIKRPNRWFIFAIKRYIRVLPNLVVVMCFMKYVSKYTGSGPYWDYGTSIGSERRYCEQDTWFYHLTFLGSFKSEAIDCIPPAWYLADDFQYFVLTPVFFAALQWSPKFGRSLVVLTSLASMIASCVSLALAEIPDMRPIANMTPIGAKISLNHLVTSYIRPYYRIAPYLFGLLLGYELHKYRQRELKFRAQTNDNRATATGGPRWPDWFVKYGALVSIVPWFTAFWASTQSLAPEIGALESRIIGPPFFPVFNLMFGFSFGFYILLGATGRGSKYLNRLLSQPIWTPLARLNLYVLITDYLVLNYLAQTAKQPVYTDFLTDSAYKLLGVVANYLVAIVFFLLFGGPIGVSIHKLFMRLNRNSSKPAEKME